MGTFIKKVKIGLPVRFRSWSRSVPAAWWSTRWSLSIGIGILLSRWKIICTKISTLRGEASQVSKQEMKGLIRNEIVEGSQKPFLITKHGSAIHLITENFKWRAHPSLIIIFNELPAMRKLRLTWTRFSLHTTLCQSKFVEKEGFTRLDYHFCNTHSFSTIDCETLWRLSCFASKTKTIVIKS